MKDFTNSRMNFLFDIGHPAHVHLFKNLIFYLKDKGHSITVTSRKKDVTEDLLDHYGILYQSLSKPGISFIGMFRELIKRNSEILNLHKKTRFDVSVGTSVSIGFLNRKRGVPAFNFNEDDDKVVRLYTILAYPNATTIFNPDCIEYSHWKSKRVLYPSYHELAYLHPNIFKPDISIPKRYGLEPYKYIIIRLSALEAHHDKGMKGISADLYRKIINKVGDVQILDTHELKGSKISAWDVHDILAYSRMIISDSQTMTIEGSVLGVPAIRVNTFIGKSTVINELEERYGLAYGFLPDQEDKILAIIDDLLKNEKTFDIWQEKKELMLQEKIDLNKWMVNYFENEIIR